MRKKNDATIPDKSKGNPTIKLRRSVYEQMLAEARDSFNKGVETGGFLAGKKEEGSIIIEAFTGPGPKAERTPCLYKPDYVHAARVLKELKDKNGYVLIGDSHIHLCRDMGLSGGDIRMIEELRSDGVFSELLYLLINVSHDACVLKFHQLRNNTLVALEYELIEDNAVEDMDFSRVLKLYNHKALAKKSVLVIGLGSGGSLLSWYFARTGIGAMGLLDGERLERENLVRHICQIGDVGRLKTEYMESVIKGINPHLKVETYAQNISENDHEFLKTTLPRYDLIINCTGHPLTSNLINKLCFELKIPSIHAGVFPQAEGGFVLQVLPDKTCCYNCVYDYSKPTIPDTEAYRNDLRDRYGISEDQLSAHQGLFMDISFVTLLEAKVALLTLLEGENHNLGKLEGNLILWNSRTFTSHVVKAERKKDCAVCNYENWLSS